MPDGQACGFAVPGGRRDTLVAPADRFLEPVHEAEGAAGVPQHAAAGMDPQVAPGFHGGPGHAQAARGKGMGRIRPQHQFARRAVGQLQILVVHHAGADAPGHAAHQAWGRATEASAPWRPADR